MATLSLIKFDGPFNLSIPSNENRFYLSAIQKYDAPKIYSILGPTNILSMDIHKWTRALPNPYTLSDAEFFVSKCLSSYSETLTCTTWAIRNDQNEFIGCIGLLLLDESSYNISSDFNYLSKNSYEVGYFISPHYRNLGITSSALNFVCDEIAFNGLGLDHLYGMTFTGNVKSERVLKKSGFKFEKILNDALVKDDKKVDISCYIKRKD
ncbi:17077_t:CDS:1 [Dentiscutata erythropus]|uniref:17077_t:CDS:1 n=1 Tax=Dentiscutata erythropus TaxID=1348616 RepID=A0A9N9AK46_9GLOM|nr:17077_t:CDS:1 [Dentiscutata erythropus]